MSSDYEKLKHIFQEALGVNNPDSEKQITKFDLALSSILNPWLSKLKAFEIALQQREFTIQEQKRFIGLQHTTVKEQKATIAKLELESKWLKLIESEHLLFLQDQASKVTTRPIEETADLLLNQLQREESSEIEGLRHLNVSLMVSYAAIADEFIDFIRIASESVVVQSEAWQAAVNKSHKVIGDQGLLIDRLKGINEKHLKKQEKTNIDLGNARKAKIDAIADVKKDLHEYWLKNIDRKKRATDAAILLERTDICKNAGSTYQPKRSTLEKYVREWQESLSKT